jgi:hypothetical protein
MHLTWNLLLLIGLLAGITAILLRLFTAPADKGKRRPWCLPWLPIVGSLPFLRNLENLASYFMTESKQHGSVLAFYAGKRYV